MRHEVRSTDFVSADITGRINVKLETPVRPKKMQPLERHGGDRADSEGLSENTARPSTVSSARSLLVSVLEGLTPLVPTLLQDAKKGWNGCQHLSQERYGNACD